MKPLINTKPGIRALEEMVKTVDYYPPGVLLFESEEPKTMLIKGEDTHARVLDQHASE